MILSPYFDLHEFACSCCGCLPDDDDLELGGIDIALILVLHGIRYRINRPLIVSSGFRCFACNEACGGVPNSQHLFGRAADVYADGVDVETLAQIARECGADGVGIYHDQEFVHVDVRGHEEARAEWSDYDD